MLLMLFLQLRIYQDIIDKNNDKLIYIGSKHPINQVYKHLQGICQTKRNNQELIMPMPCAKHLLGNVFQANKSWWYSYRKLIFEKVEAPCNWSNRLPIHGKGYLFLIMTLFNCLESIQSRIEPSFCFTNNIGAPHGDTLGWINLLSSKSWSCTFSSRNSNGAIL